jgi:putative DNA primase/helicase
MREDSLAAAEEAAAESFIRDGERERERLARRNAKPEALVVKLSSVTPRDVEWIRPQRWPQGKLCLVVGDPGLGKSLLLLDAAARISTGRSWPEGTPAPAGRVLILTAEDGLDDTVVPRLLRMGADLSQIHVLRAIRQDGRERPFNLAGDIDQLRCAIEQVQPVAVFFDPLSAYIGKTTDSHTDADVRGVLHPVATLADEFNVAIVALMHLNKATQMRALYRVTGSVAFTAAARSVFAVVEEGETERRLFVPLKMNLAPKPGALAFRILGGDVPALDWDPDPVPNVDVEAALRGPGTDESGESRNEREDAKAFLNELLNDGPVPANRVKREAKQAMIAEKTLQRAKADLGVRSKREGGIGSEGEWFWYLPKMATSSRHTDDVAIIGESKPESQETTHVSPKMAMHSVSKGCVATLPGAGHVATTSDSRSQTLGTTWRPRARARGDG